MMVYKGFYRDLKLPLTLYSILLACSVVHDLGILAFWTEHTFQFADIENLDMCRRNGSC